LGNSLRQTVHTHRASVHQAAKLIADLLRVARVTAGVAESNGSLPPGLLRHQQAECQEPGSAQEQGSFRAGTHRNAVPVLFLITGTPFRSFSAYSESVVQKQQVAVRFSCVYNVYTRFMLTILLQVSLK